MRTGLSTSTSLRHLAAFSVTSKVVDIIRNPTRLLETQHMYIFCQGLKSQPQELQRQIDYLHREAESTLDQQVPYVAHIKTMFKAAVDQDLLIKSPFNSLRVSRKRFNREWHYVSAETLQKVLDACPNPGWRCFLTLQRYGGLRRGEAMKVTWRMVDLDSKQIRLPAETAAGEKVTKTRQPRTIPMAPTLFIELSDAKPDDANSDDLVVTGVNSTSISNQHSRMRTILKRAGVEPSEDLFQTLRRCAAQDLRALLKDGWAVTQIMGHSEDVERDYYLSHLRQEDIDKVTETKIDPSLEKVIADWKTLAKSDRKEVLKLIQKLKPS